MSKLVGILNLTPDSFSDGGKYDIPQAAYTQAERLIADGADVIDIGAESTRPNAKPISPHDEWLRLSPILSSIIIYAHQCGVQVSVDTRHANTAMRAIALGADWINDVSCGRSQQLMHVVAEAKVTYVAMHSLGVPANPEVILPCDRPAIEYVREGLERLLERAEAAGIERSYVILDAGFGFGKSKQQSLNLLWEMPKLKSLGCKLLAGHSRKSFLSLISKDIANRDMLTLFASSYLTHCNIDYLRVHNVHSHATLRNDLSV